MSSNKSMCHFEVTRLRQLSAVFGVHPNLTALQQVTPVLVELREQEDNLRLFSEGPQFYLRPKIVSWLKQTAEEFGLLKKTIFHGVYLFDQFSAVHDISKSQIHLVALVCLNLASKFEERESSHPKMKVLHKRLPKDTSYTDTLFVDIETFVLKHFEWKIIFPTVLHFFEYFVMFAIGSDDVGAVEDPNNNGAALSRSTSTGIHSDREQVTSVGTAAVLAPTRKLKLKKEMTERLAIMADVTADVFDYILDEPSKVYPPSVVAAACIMIAREVVGMSVWTKELEAVSQYNQADVEECKSTYLGRIVKEMKMIKN